MSDLVLHNWVFLAPLITEHNNPLILEILDQLSINQIKAICEIAINTYYGVIPITKLYRNRLSPYKDLFDSLSEKKPISKKKIDLLKQPEFISLLLKAVQKQITTELYINKSDHHEKH
jgi:hypothetical protein